MPIAFAVFLGFLVLMTIVAIVVRRRIVQPGPTGPYLFKTVPVRQWRSELCPGLVEAIERMRAVEPVAIASIGYANVKMPEQVTQLARRPGAASLAALRGFAGSCETPLLLSDDGIGCRQHWASIDWPHDEASACSN
jgi:hypothetical protein